MNETKQKNRGRWEINQSNSDQSRLRTTKQKLADCAADKQPFVCMSTGGWLMLIDWLSELGFRAEKHTTVNLGGDLSITVNSLNKNKIKLNSEFLN